LLTTKPAVGEHHAGNRACYGQLSLLSIHRKRLSARTTRLLRARLYIRRCFSSWHSSSPTDLDGLTNYYDDDRTANVTTTKLFFDFFSAMNIKMRHIVYIHIY
jgi:hypothetical protein